MCTFHFLSCLFKPKCISQSGNIEKHVTWCETILGFIINHHFGWKLHVSRFTDIFFFKFGVCWKNPLFTSTTSDVCLHFFKWPLENIAASQDQGSNFAAEYFSYLLALVNKRCFKQQCGKNWTLVGFLLRPLFIYTAVILTIAKSEACANNLLLYLSRFFWYQCFTWVLFFCVLFTLTFTLHTYICTSSFLNWMTRFVTVFEII